MNTWRTWVGSVSLLGVAVGVTVWPIDSLGRWIFVIRGVAWLVFVAAGMIYTAGGIVERMETTHRTEMDLARQSFYSKNLDARADRAHRVFRQLLRDSDKLWLVGADRRSNEIRRWDEHVKLALSEHCVLVRLDLYRVDTGRPSGHEADLTLDRLPDAREHLVRLLADLEDLPINWLR